MHREIMNAKKGEIIDHKDRNGLNCQRHNLRFATHGQNNSNMSSRNGSTSKYLGVCLRRGIKKNVWRATICKNKKQTFLGHFDNELDAALAYNKKAKELHGEFANLNVIA